MVSILRATTTASSVTLYELFNNYANQVKRTYFCRQSPITAAYQGNNKKNKKKEGSIRGNE